ncbi:MAG: OsmC family protein [Devosia sp.]|uniref:OsmC family protein n=1 Tax=Devosia sp. TaxID=1871048 RepID=UPI001AC4A7B0|nr:OsmC family protein [Devosia sp.]MBN9315486.1 OsmC family protein [Devosia sp.]
MLEYTIEASRPNGEGGAAVSHGASVVLDTTLAGRPDAFNPVELLLAALAACMLKGVERSAPMIRFEFRSASVKLHAVRQDAPPKLVSIDYELAVDTDEPERRLELLHSNVIKYGTISNTLAAAVPLTGTIRRAT